jgi:hypothetical protein
MYDRLYRQAVGAEQHDPTFLGLWWRADDDDVGLDREQLVKANPALDDGRLSWASIKNEYLILPRGSWIRERLNRWSDERVDAPFSLAQWGACRMEEPLSPEKVNDGYVISADVTSTWSEGSIIVAAQLKDGRVGIEVHRHLLERNNVPLSADDFTQEIARLSAKIKVDAITYSASSPLAPAFERAKVESQLPYESVNAVRNIMACADFAEAITSKRIAHNDPFLDAQVASAQRRFVGGDGAWRWTISNAPVTGVVAATFAVAYAAKNVGPVQVFI